MIDNPTDNPKAASPAVKPAGSVDKTKIEVLRQLLSRRNGATSVQIQNHLALQPHTVRAAISRLRQSCLSVELDRSDGMARYRAVSRVDR